jgi:hypothetical protein
MVSREWYQFFLSLFNLTGAGNNTISIPEIIDEIITDHGHLTGLGDDDHQQYLNNARGDDRYTPKSHIGTGGNAHAVVVSGGASGFMTGPDKEYLDELPDV